MTEELKPCMICEKADKIHIYSRWDPVFERTEYTARCDRLKCKLKRLLSNRVPKERCSRSLEEAVDEWNNRQDQIWRKIE